ncbi:ceramidase domain-containing protein [Polycladidibacter stylochi]|uniref:ceramidase domain-containing protein n=1 Tax=Polycladidibacter stylochi TaxID=1807766 RepID=UPI000836D53C|nr:ceramidase domain-containing protein [Pseudovibrio stylochi]
MHDYIDIYCERINGDFWSEPLNAISNLSFIIAAFWGIYLARRKGVYAWPVWLAIILSGLIGVGSFLFHSFASSAAELSDVLPIWTFVVWYVLCCFLYLGNYKMNMKLIAILMGAGIAGMVLWLQLSGALTTNGYHHTHHPATLLNGSQQYLPAVISLYIFAFVCWRNFAKLAPSVITAALVFSVSLVFRSIDLHSCSHVPIGTHFVWHLLNGLMIALLLHSLVIAAADHYKKGAVNGT